MSRINRFCTDSRSFFWQAYILIMAVIFPLYIKADGYANIGSDKYLFYKNITISVLAVAYSITLIIVLTDRKGSAYHKQRVLVTASEMTAILFVGVALLSFFLSSYREAAWAGAEGWFMGLMTLLLVMASYFGISRMWKYSGSVWIGFAVGSGITYILGICNRFSFYPIPLEIVVPEFISTLGNINWFSGYFAVMWPIGACIYLFSGSVGIRIAAGIYTAIAFGAGVTQGSSSAFLSFIAVFYILFLVCLGRWKEYGRKWMELAAIWCLTCQIIRVIRIILPGRYNYPTDNVCAMVTGSSFSLLLLVLIALLYGVAKTHTICAIMDSRIFKHICMVIPVAGIVLYFLLLTGNTLLPGGFPGFAENSYFVFDQAWGNARGATWGTGFELFSRMNLQQKLFGVGPDCFSEYLYGHPDIVEGIDALFNGAILRNAHNEWLTMLVNTGILGLTAYVGIFATVIGRFIKRGTDHPVLYIPAVCAFSYAVHNMVSFGQVLNMPLLFIIMGIGESYFRQHIRKTEAKDDEKSIGI